MPRSTVITDRQRAQIYEKYLHPTRAPYEDFIPPIGGRVDAEQYISPIIFQEIEKTNEFFTAASTENDEDQRLPRADAYTYASAYATATPAQPQVIHHHHHSGIPWWAFCLMNRGGTTNNYYGTSAASGRAARREDGNFAAWAGMLVIAGVVFVPAAIGAFYLMSELGNNLERLYYNEGYLQAGLGMANIALSLSLSAILTNAVLSTAITALAVSAGFANPVSWAFFIMGCVTLFVAACIHWAVQEGIYHTNAHFNKNALHPEEPGRFTITDAQVADIGRKDRQRMKSLDGDKMQNVITAIHHDMTADPSRMTRIFRYSPFFRDAETAAGLQAIRTLRMTGTVNYATTVETDNHEEKSFNFTAQSLRK